MKKIKSVALAILLCLITSLFCGCGAEIKVAVSEVTSTDSMYVAEVKLSTELEEELTSENTNRSVENYLNALCYQCGIDATVTRYVQGGQASYTIIFYESVNFLETNKSEGYSVSRQEGFLFDTITVRMKNPLNRIADVVASGSMVTTTNTAEYVAYVIANGKGTLLPIDEYFSMDGVSGDDIALYYLVQRRNLMESSAEVELFNANDYYVFSSSLKTDGDEVVYSKKSPNAPVWYCLCIVVGAVVVGVILLVTIKSKKKDAIVDNTVFEQKRLAYKKTRNASARIVPIRKETPDVYGYEKTAEEEKGKNDVSASQDNQETEATDFEKDKNEDKE